MLRMLVKRIFPTDERLPIKAIAGLHNVVPYNCITTQVSTSNWPHGEDCFFFELKGEWKDVPPMDVIVLSGDGGVRYSPGQEFRPLSPDEQIQAIEFMRNNWPNEGARPHIRLVSLKRETED